MCDDRPRASGGRSRVEPPQRRHIEALRHRVGLVLQVLGAAVPRCAVAVIVLTGAAAFAQTPAPTQLVIPFENATRDPRGIWLGEGSAVVLTEDLRALGMPAIPRDDRLRAFERLRVPMEASLSLATAIRLGQVVGAEQVILGSFELRGNYLAVKARTIQLDSGRMSPEVVELGTLPDLFAIYGRLARRIAPNSTVSEEQMEQGHPPLAAFEQYIKGVLAEAPATQTSFLTQALRTAPTYHRARIALWQVHTEQGEHQQALNVIREVPPDHRLAREARFLAGVSMLNLAQYQGAFDAFFELNRAMPDPALLNNLGIVQLRRPAGSPSGRPISYFGEAVKLDGNDPDLFFNLGYAYWLDRDTQGAINWLREAVRRDPSDDEAHYALGVALQAAGSTAEAAREKELARQLSSETAEWDTQQKGANAIPRGLERLKLDIDVPQTLRPVDIVVAAEQRDQREAAAFHLETGKRFYEADRDEEAIAELRRTVFLAPYEASAHLLLAKIYMRNGRAEDAIDALKIAVWSDPANAEARELLARISPK
jgi:Flp pilus assembly protein TadD